MKIYFICLYGNVRSKAAARQFKLRAEKDNLEMITDYAGVISDEQDKKPKQELIDRADLIVTFEEEVFNRTKKEYSLDKNKTWICKIQDIYNSHDDETLTWRLNNLYDELKSFGCIK